MLLILAAGQSQQTSMEQQMQMQQQQIQQQKVVEQQQQQQSTKLQAQATTQQSEELEDQEIFVPLRQIGRVQKNALAEATAMAKMKDEHFELVVNIQKFTPEEVKVYVEGQAVLVTAKHCTQEGFVTDTFEHKFSLPEDVDATRLTSGISSDGILMIRVPRRTPERIIPIQFDAKISTVKKAIQQSVQVVESEVSAEEVREELIKVIFS